MTHSMTTTMPPWLGSRPRLSSPEARRLKRWFLRSQSLQASRRPMTNLKLRDSREDRVVKPSTSIQTPEIMTMRMLMMNLTPRSLLSRDLKARSPCLLHLKLILLLNKCNPSSPLTRTVWLLRSTTLTDPLYLTVTICINDFLIPHHNS